MDPGNNTTHITRWSTGEWGWRWDTKTVRTESCETGCGTRVRELAVKCWRAGVHGPTCETEWDYVTACRIASVINAALCPMDLPPFCDVPSCSHSTSHLPPGHAFAQWYLY